MTLTREAAEVGQLVQVTRTFTETDLNGYSRVEFSTAKLYQIRRVGSGKVVLRDVAAARSAWVPLNWIASPDPNAPKPRKLGETPEGDHIAIDDPRIMWIWEDAGKVADNNGYCPTYDKLAEELGAPGRERTYKVWTEINGLKARVEVKARSKKLAEAHVSAAIPAGVVSNSELD